MTKYIVTDAQGRQVASFVFPALDIDALDEMDEEQAEAYWSERDADKGLAFIAACVGQGLNPLECSAYEAA